MEILLTIVAMALAAFYAVYALGDYLYIVLPALGLVAAYLAVAFWRRKAELAAEVQREEAEEQAAALARAEAEKAEGKRRTKILCMADEFLHQARSWLTPCLVIDSQVWMGETYDGFFTALRILCREAGYVLALYGPQFDEITAARRATAYEGTRNKASRLAIQRIEDLQKLQLLRIEPAAAPRPDGGAPLLVQLLAAQARAGNACTLISADKELRIRAREHFNREAQAQWQVVEM